MTANHNMPGMTRDEMVVCMCTSGHTSKVRLMGPRRPASFASRSGCVVMSAAIQKEELDDGDDERIDE